MAKKAHERTTKFLKWIRKYNGLWYLICTPGEEHMNPQMMKKLIEQLSQESLYEIIFVLLMVHRDAPFMEHIADRMLLDTLADNWENSREKFTRNLISHFE